jgi:allantoinase
MLLQTTGDIATSVSKNDFDWSSNSQKKRGITTSKEEKRKPHLMQSEKKQLKSSSINNKYGPPLLLVIIIAAVAYYLQQQQQPTTPGTTPTTTTSPLPYCTDFLIVKSKRVVTDSSVTIPLPASIVIVNGSIDSVREYEYSVPLHSTSCQYLIDAGDFVVMPGMVDTHVHMNEPGRTHWEGFETATKAAAAGGVTTVIDMPLNSLPPTTSVHNLNTKIEASKDKLYVDVGFLGGVIPGNENDLRELYDAGVLGFKSFMIHSGVDEFPAVSEQDMKNAMKALNGTNAVYMLHAEVDVSDVVTTGDGRKYSTFLASRPDSMEVKAIESVINVCKEEYGVRCHVVHVATAEALPLLRNAGKHITSETCTHYLYFSAEEIRDGATEFKCCPPIRSAANKEALWEGLREGIISMVTSDHSPSPLDMKSTGNFLKDWGGISSLEISLPALVNSAAVRGFGIHHLVKWKSEEPAKLVGLDKRKGKIQSGYDGDIVVWNPAEAFLLNVADENMFKHKHKSSPYNNRALQGRVQMTLLRGNVIYELTEKGQGKLSAASGSILRR